MPRSSTFHVFVTQQVENPENVGTGGAAVPLHRIVKHHGVVPGDAVFAKQLLGTHDPYEQPAHVAGDIVVLELPPGHADGAGDQFPLNVFVHSDVHDHQGGVRLV